MKLKTKSLLVGLSLAPLLVQPRLAQAAEINITTYDHAFNIDEPVSSVSVASATTVDILTNNSTINSAHVNDGVGILNNGAIGNLINNGTISSLTAGIKNTGTIVSLDNNGIIRSPGLALSFDSFDPTSVHNNGLILGDIKNASSDALTFRGNTTNTGVLSGYETITSQSSSANFEDLVIGTITSATGVVFENTQQILNNNINAGTSTVSNNDSMLAVLNPISITGNYTQSSNAILLIGVRGNAVAQGKLTDSGYGRLTVSGSAVIDPNASVNVISLGPNLVDGQRFVVITAAKNGTNYNAGTLSYLTSGYDGVTSGSVVNSGNSSSLVVSLGTTTPDTPEVNNTPATTGNAVASLKGLKQYSGIAPGLLDLYNASLAISSSGEANKVGEQLSPAQNNSASNAASLATFDAVGVVGQRVDSVRLAQTRGMSGVATGDDPADWSAWGQAFGGHANQGMVDDVSGYKANYSGLVLGGDRGLGDAWRAGGALTYSHTAVRGQDNLSGNKTDVDSYGLIGYASYTGEPWYVNLSASATQQRYSSTRNVGMTGYSDRAQGKFDGQQYVTKAEFGYPLNVADSTTLTPLANLSYSYLTLDGYKENSGNGSALDVEGSHNNALRSGLGARLDTSFQTGIGDVVPYVQAVWTHQYNAKRSATTASYVADTTGETSFTTFGASPAEDTADLSLGATVLQSDTLSLTARYNLQLAEQYQGQTVSFQVRKQF